MQRTVHRSGRDVRQKQCLVLLQPLRQQIVFMDEIEQKPTFKQSKIETMDVHHGISKFRGSIEALGTLAHHHSNVGYGTLISEVILVLREPGKELAPGFVPAAVGPRPSSAPMKWYHGTMPLATVSLIHICASSVDLWMFRQRGFPVE